MTTGATRGAMEGDGLAKMVGRLVSVDSVNPELVPEGAGEAEIAELVAARLEDAGLDVTVLESTPGRPSVVGRLRGRGGGRSLTLNAHTDTVGVAGMDAPFEPVVRDGRLYGRGAYDMKGSLAACLAVAEGLAGSGEPLAGDLVVAAVADEEHASLGSREVLESFRTDGAVITEPTGLDVCVAHKGFAWAEIDVEGRAAHGSRPDLGRDANLAMAPVLEELRRLADRLAEREPHPRLGPPSLHVGRLDGGTAPSVYAARCRATVERRLLPGEGSERVSAELAEVLERARARTGEGPPDASVRLGLVREGFETSPESELVRALRTEAARVLGRPPPLVGEAPWTDAALYAAAGVDTVVLGPSGGGAHADREWVDLSSVESVAAILEGLARRYCG